MGEWVRQLLTASYDYDVQPMPTLANLGMRLKF